MFDARTTPDAQTLRAVRAWLVADPGAGAAGQADRIDRIRAAEELKCALAAFQAVLTAEFDTQARADHAARGLPVEEQGKGVAAQIALARRESPYRGREHVALARALADDMPHSRQGLAAGWLSEHRAAILARETSFLTREDRQAVDARLCQDPSVLDGAGNRAVANRARSLAAQLDAEAVLARRRKAESQRRVSIRPAPDTMTWIGILAPVVQGVAVFATLRRQAEAARAAGDPRSLDQLMVDLLVAAITGRDPALGHGVDVRVNLVMTNRSLFAGYDEAAHVEGYGTIPADLARQMLDQAGDVSIQRLFTHPSTGELIAMDARSRPFTDAMKKFLVLRDQTCRTPWCDAPVKHADHAIRVSDGGRTSVDNGQGLCEACNYAKEAPGWRAGPAPDSDIGHHRITTTTPTGHTYTSRPPPMPGAA